MSITGSATNWANYDEGAVRTQFGSALTSLFFKYERQANMDSLVKAEESSQAVIRQAQNNVKSLLVTSDKIDVVLKAFARRNVEVEGQCQ